MLVGLRISVEFGFSLFLPSLQLSSCLWVWAAFSYYRFIFVGPGAIRFIRLMSSVRIS